LTSLGLANPGNSSCGEELPVTALGQFKSASLLNFGGLQFSKAATELLLPITIIYDYLAH
jgi:hypothetical protein